MGVAHVHRAGELQIGRIDGADLEVDAARIHPFGQRDFFPFEQGRAHVDGDAFLARPRSFQAAGEGLDGETVCAAFFHHQPADAAGGVAAGLRFRSVAVEDAHEDVAAQRALHGDHLISADAGRRVGDGPYALRRQVKPFRPAVKYDEGVASSIHLPELHGASM
jgi:hypothetical protein